MTPKVTIIVAAYNKPDFLFRCLLAIKLQTFKEFECIVISDNCQYSEKVFNDSIFVNDGRFRYYRIDKKEINMGAIGKNLGINLSSTNYICYCDDDNILFPNHVKILYDTLMSSNVKVVFSNFYHVNYETDIYSDTILSKQLYVIEHGNKDCTITINNSDALCCMHTKDLAIEIGGWTSYENDEKLFNEDGVFMRKLKETAACIFLKEVTCVYNHWKKKEYNLTLQMLNDNQIYCYPEIIEDLKKTHLSFVKHLFVHVPKTGGLFMHDVIVKKYPHLIYYHDHTPISQVPKEFKDLPSFTFVRNPYERLISAYYFLRAGGVRNSHDLSMQKLLLKYTCFKDFVMNIKLDFLISKIQHLKPMCYYLCDDNGQILVNKILKLEELYSINEFLNKIGISESLPMYNVSQHSRYWLNYFDDKMLYVVNKLYELDFKLFGYKMIKKIK